MSILRNIMTAANVFAGRSKMEQLAISVAGAAAAAIVAVEVSAISVNASALEVLYWLSGKPHGSQSFRETANPATASIPEAVTRSSLLPGRYSYVTQPRPADNLG